MISEEEALGRILAQVHPLAARTVPLAKAVDGFVAEEIRARLALPGFDNSAMDGYAVVAKSATAGARLRLVGEQPAGLDRALTVRAGEAIRIFTGAPLPRGADAVVMQEETTVEDGEVILQTGVAEGEFVRRRGGDVTEGQRLVEAGECVSPQTLALLASQGLTEISLGGQVRVALISTGDELAEPGASLRPGQIYETNSVLLRALLERAGAEVVSQVHCADEGETIERSLRAALACDVIIITGGVSVGARDLVKPALSRLGATLDLWRVAVKPGKPFLFGRLDRSLIFGLPGNPVSAFVTFLLFVRPALRKLMGAADDALRLRSVPLCLAEALANESDRPHYVRGRITAGDFAPIGRQESHALWGLSRANALLRVGAGERLDAGTNATALTWD